MVQGKSSKEFVSELGYLGEEEIVHRDNICLLSQRRFQANFSEATLPEQGGAGEEEQGTLSTTLHAPVLHSAALYLRLQHSACGVEDVRWHLYNGSARYVYHTGHVSAPFGSE